MKEIVTNRRGFLKGVAALGVLAAGAQVVPALASERSAEADGEAAADSAAAEEFVPGPTEYPLVIENNGVEWTFEKAPESVVVLSYVEAEVLVALGVADKIVALAPGDYLLEYVLEEYREEVGALTMFEEDELQYGVVPNFEAVLSREPDFVVSSYYSFFDVNAGSVDKYVENGINAYASEGTYDPTPSMENVYDDIINLGRIFDVQERAKEIVDELRADVNELTSKLEGVEKTPVFVYDFASETGLSTVGGPAFESCLIDLAGGENVFGDLEKQYPEVSAEEVASCDAELIIINAYVESTGDDADAKMETMKTDELFSEIPAVMNDNFLSMQGIEYQPGLHAVPTIKKLAAALHPEVDLGE